MVGNSARKQELSEKNEIISKHTKKAIIQKLPWRNKGRGRELKFLDGQRKPECKVLSEGSSQQ